MDKKYLQTLEYPKILERLAGFTSFSASRQLALSLLPSSDSLEVRRRQDEVREARDLLSVNQGIGIGGARDVRHLLEDARRGAVFHPLEYLEIKTTLLSGRALKRSLSRMAPQYPRLATIAGTIEECAHVTAEITRCIDERGEVHDGASPTLARIRRELRLAHSRVIERLNRLISSSDTAGFLQEPLITQRSGRYVIPLKSEFKGRIPGLIHDQSSSGATLFIEPLATVELNNQLRTLQIEDENEVRRILAGLSELISDEAEYIERTVMALADLDLAFARARFAEELNAVSPVFVPVSPPRAHQAVPELRHPGTTIDFRRARHPLLDPATVVPIDVHLGKDYFVLVITGPNTGGKTVSLKSVGLLTVMAQAGLQIPVDEGSHMSVFEAVYADIGDEQSIEQSLSTFSSHMTNIVHLLQHATPASLVLLDELGAGTDPEEGSALARAILSHLVRRGITTLATTHYSELKVYAHSTPGVQNASVEFDIHSLSPTYELTIGLPGRSNAFAIARRLGLLSSIVEEAKGMVSIGSLEAEGMLAQLKQAQDDALEERRRATAERDEAARLRKELNEKLGEIESTRAEVLEQSRQQARQELESLLSELEEIRTQARQELRMMRQSQGMERLETLQGQVESLAQTLEPEDQPEIRRETESWEPPRVGDVVWVKNLDVEGEVTLAESEEVEVSAGSFRVRLPARTVYVRHRAPGVPTPPSPATWATTMSLPSARPALELDLRGLRTEEALLRLEKYLDDAFLSNLPWVRVIHGKGTGALRQAVRSSLKGHPQVSSFRTGEMNEGGDGVTVVTLGSRTSA